MFLTVAKHTGHAPYQTTNHSSSNEQPVLYLLSLVDYAVLAKRLSVAEGHGLGLASGQGNASGSGLGRMRKNKGPGLGTGAENHASYAPGPGLGLSSAQNPGLGGLRRAMSLRTTPVNSTPTLTGKCH